MSEQEVEHRRNKYIRCAGCNGHQLFCVCGFSTEHLPNYESALEEFRAHAPGRFTSGVIVGTRVSTLIDEDGVEQQVTKRVALIQNDGDHAYVDLEPHAADDGDGS